MKTEAYWVMMNTSNLSKKYLIEKTGIYQRMKTSDKELAQWTDTLVAVFNFTVDIRKRWLYGDIEDKKLTITPRSPFRAIEKTVSNPSFEAKSGMPDFYNSVLGPLPLRVRTSLKLLY